MATSFPVLQRADRPIAATVDVWASLHAALDPDIPLKKLRAFARSEAPAVRRAAAFNVAAPTDLLRELSHDADTCVREAAEYSLKARGVR